MFCSAWKNNAKGFTLAEAMVATVILSIAAAGVLAPFVAGASVRAEGQRMTLAAKLASDLMEQIVNTDFDSLVSTWDGFAESQGQIKDITGAVFSDQVYSQFSREASCVEVYLVQESGDDEPVFIRATVNVYYQGREIASVSRLISK